jgi:KUP system potassium uptake protein
MSNSDIHKQITTAGLLTTLGIVFGDIGTSPLYVMKAIVGDKPITEDLILGALSCVFWTLTLVTTFKYIYLTLQADNNGEGGIFSLYALVRKRRKWLYIPAVIGASTLFADGIITPPISVSSAVEGLHIVSPDLPVMPIVIAIITLLFMFQRFGTKVVGVAFGPIMIVWFTALAALGFNQFMHNPGILRALNPVYAFNLLTDTPGGFFLLGAVFLATTGADALYSDLGHCGRKNVRLAWALVKPALLLNYFGQGAWLLSLPDGKLNGLNPFYEIMPGWFFWPGIVIATLATIIASQAMITGAFTLMSEAVSLNFYPKVNIKFPSDIKGQVYIPSINWILWAGCIAVVLYFQESERMESAYGFNITVTMLMTSVLMTFYLSTIRNFPWYLTTLLIFVFISVELAFSAANIIKLKESWMFLLIVFAMQFVMFIWYTARKRLSRFISFVDLKQHLPTLIALSQDQSIAKYATHLIYLTKANNFNEIERRIFYSIISRNPKRADVYWFIHIDRTDEPYTMEFEVRELVDDNVIRIDFRLGFRIQPRVNVLFRHVIEHLVANNELDITSRYESLKGYNLPADFKFVLQSRFLSVENEFSVMDGFILNTYFSIKRLAQTDAKAFGLDTSDVVNENIPMIIQPSGKVALQRVRLQVDDTADAKGEAPPPHP